MLMLVLPQKRSVLSVVDSVWLISCGYSKYCFKSRAWIARHKGLFDGGALHFWKVSVRSEGHKLAQVQETVSSRSTYMTCFGKVWKLPQAGSKEHLFLTSFLIKAAL